MEISLRSSSFTEVSHCYSILSLNSISITSSRSLRDLSGKRRGDSDIVQVISAVVDGHLFSFSEIELVSAQLVGHIVDSEASPEKSSDLSVLRENKILELKSSA